MKIFLTGKDLLSETSTWIKSVLHGHVNDEHTISILIVFNEVIQNIYRYSYEMREREKIECILELSENSITITMTDYGRPCIDQSFLEKQHKATEAGGMGLKIITENSDKFEIQPTSTGNITLLRFKAIH